MIGCESVRDTCQCSHFSRHQPVFSGKNHSYSAKIILCTDKNQQRTYIMTRLQTQILTCKAWDSRRAALILFSRDWTTCSIAAGRESGSACWMCQAAVSTTELSALWNSMALFGCAGSSAQYKPH